MAATEVAVEALGRPITFNLKAFNCWNEARAAACCVLLSQQEPCGHACLEQGLLCH
jgi:hypothetical protein